MPYLVNIIIQSGEEDGAFGVIEEGSLLQQEIAMEFHSNVVVCSGA